MDRQKTARWAIVVIVLFAFVLAVGGAFAATEPSTGGSPPDPSTGGRSVRIDNFLGFENIEQLIEAVIPKLIAFATSIVTIMVLWAAYQLLFAGANPSLVEKAKKTLLWTVVGYAIILLGSGIAYIVKDVLTNPAAGQQQQQPPAQPRVAT